MIAEDVGFPLLVRPSYVLGGPRDGDLLLARATSRPTWRPNVKADQEHPLLLDRFLEDAIEVDVDALADGEDCTSPAIMQHVEEAGVHSGDSACVIPPMSLGEEMLERDPRRRRGGIALELGVIGLINIQYAVAGGRALRDRGQPARLAHGPLRLQGDRGAAGEARLPADAGRAAGRRWSCRRCTTGHVSVKEAVLPFARFAGADSVLGPEMKSTGEVMGIAADFPTAFGKAQAAAGVALPSEGTVFITVTDNDKAAATQLAARFHDLGFEIIATEGTAQAISRMGIPVRAINKIGEGSPHVVDFIRNGEVDLVINTPTGSGARSDGYEIRSAAVRHGIPCITTMTGASAAARAIFARREQAQEPLSLQELHAQAAGSRQQAEAKRMSERVLAPFGRRSCEVVANAATGGYRIDLSSRSRGADAERGPVLHARHGRAGAESSGRPYLPRAFSVAEAEAGEGGVRLDFLLEAVGPGTGRLAAARARRAAASDRPAGAAVLGPRRAEPAMPPGRSSSAAGSGSRRWRSWRRELADRGVPQRVLLGFRDRSPLGRPRPVSTARRCARRREDGHAGHRGYVTDLLAVLLEGDDAGSAAVYACGPPAMLEAVREMCAEREVRRRAGDGDADGLRLRRLLRLRRAARGRRLHAALRRRAGGARRRGRDARCVAGSRALSVHRLGVDLCGPPASSTRSSTAPAPSTRSPPAGRSATAVEEAFPFSAFVSKTITPEPRPAIPPPRLYETPAGMVNSIGLPNKGLEGFLIEDLPQLARAAGAADRLGDGAEPRAGSPRLVERVGSRDEVAAIELNVSCPNVKSGLIVGEQPAETLRAARGAPAADRQAADRQADSQLSPTRRRSRAPPRRGARTRSR